MYYLIWEYEVESPKQSQFEEYYLRSGPWFKFFEPCDDYLGHDLLKGDKVGKYVIIDKWMGKIEYDSFIQSNLSEYNRLSEESSALYNSENLIGTYQTLS